MFVARVCLRKINWKWSPMFILSLLAATLFLSSCASPPPPPAVAIKRVATIVSFPEGASITVDNRVVGVAPIRYEFNFSDKQFFTVTGTKANHLHAEMRVDAAAVDRAGGTLTLHLLPHPFIGITGEKYTANAWFVITLTPEILEQDLWDKFVRIIKKQYPKIRKEEMDSGVVETSFRTQKIMVGSNHEYLRSTVKTKFMEKFPKVRMGIYLETEVSKDGKNWTKYSKPLLSDIALVDSLQKQLDVYYYLYKQ